MSIEEAKRLARIGNVLLLIGEAIIVTVDDPSSILQAATIQLIGGFILTKSTEIAVAVNKLDDNPIPEELNQRKLIGSLLSMIGSIISTQVLFEETALRTGDEPVIPPFGFISS